MTCCCAEYAISISRCVVILSIYVARTPEPGVSEEMRLTKVPMAVAARLGILLRGFLSRAEVSTTRHRSGSSSLG
jgi:hypothetical protein